MFLRVYGHDDDIDGTGGRTFTCFEALDREGGLCQEVGVTEHVLLVHHKAEEGKLRVIDVKDKLLEEPDRVEAIVSLGGKERAGRSE